MIENHLSRYNHYETYRKINIFNLRDRYAISTDEELFCDEFVKDDDLSLKEYQNILKFFGAVSEENIFYNPWQLELEVRHLSYFTTLEDCKEAIDYLCNRKKRNYVVYDYNLLYDIEKFISISQIWPALKVPSPFRAHYKCANEEVKIFGEKIYGSHYTFYRGKDILANFVLTKDGCIYLISCNQSDIWDALKECKVVDDDFLKRE